MSFGWESGSFGMVEELNNSILASIGSAIAWIFTPLGWTNAGEGWKMAVAAITGLIAKERCSNFRYVIWIRRSSRRWC